MPESTLVAISECVDVVPVTYFKHINGLLDNYCSEEPWTVLDERICVCLACSEGRQANVYLMKSVASLISGLINYHHMDANELIFIF